MASKKQVLNEYEAAVNFGFSPDLLRWFTRHPVIDGHTLAFSEKNGLYYFKIDDLWAFDKKLNSKWPLPAKGKRPNIPDGIKREIKQEAQYRCPVCHTTQGEAAHIHAVAKTYCNHPKNLLFLCPNHHTEYDYGKKTANVDIDDVLHFKVGLQRFNKIQWQLKGEIIHTYVGALNSAISLIGIQKKLAGIIPDKDYRDLLCKISKASVKAGGKEIRETTPRILRQEIEENASLESVNVCPLCHGVGNTEVYTLCPICYGNGEIDEKDIGTIDISHYEVVDCILCEGTGSYNSDYCPACEGEGKVPKGFAEEHDWSQYTMVDCKLCKGTGSYNSDYCPACEGEGQVPKGFADNNDWSQYDLVDCRLCDGTGVYNNDYCPACEGKRQVTKGFADNNDWSQYI